MKKQDFIGYQDRVNVAPAMNRFGHQDSASAATAQNREMTQDSASDVSRSQAKITTKAPGQRKRPHHASLAHLSLPLGIRRLIVDGTTCSGLVSAFHYKGIL